MSFHSIKAIDILIFIFFASEITQVALSQIKNNSSLYPSYLRLWIIGGMDADGNSMKDVEMIDPMQSDSNCPEQIDFKYNVVQMVTGTMNRQPLLCGGIRSKDDQNQPTANCYYYHSMFAIDRWDLTTDQLSSFRYRSSSVPLRDGLITWILGGDGKNGEPMTSEIVYETGQIEMGPALPEPMQSHCSVLINSTHVFLAGNGYEPQRQAYIVDTSRDPFHFNKLPSMQSRRFGAACSVVVDPVHGTRLLVAGGDPPRYESTELYSLEDNVWTYGPQLNRGFIFGGYFTYPDAPNTFILIGGKDGENNYHTDIMGYNVSENSFEYLPGNIRKAKVDFGVYPIQSSKEC